MIMAGGTGGHIFPGLAVAEELKGSGAAVTWLGTAAGLESRLVPERGIALERITIGGLRGRGLAGWLLAPWRVMRAVWQARAILRRHRPACVLSMGGYVAGPGALAARLMGIPLVIHEQNAIAGLTNRLLRPLARRVMTGFPDTLRGGEHVGNPVRADIVAMAPPAERMAGRTGPLRLLVVGGSQGAAVFSEQVPEALADMPPSARPVVVHQAGRQYEQTRSAYERLGVEGEIHEFIEDMATALGQADLALCRSGALTVSELSAAGVASILVPFPHAVDDHQTANARFLSDADAAWLLPQAELDAGKLSGLLSEMSRERLMAMAARARNKARTDAAEQVARACLEVAR
ncbi:undecaprenyldiphospho-muramoylpentapeptide beta-N-acetylglucosaminyltransferase [Wenzhouxiangella sp. AB-CW3]|nr:undecaprenyldiphospho-muramoylpentapeptide beta-N-acetylglucosaminyltransferase [Wenzhouxiangella sp. AB-CW3]